MACHSLRAGVFFWGFRSPSVSAAQESECSTREGRVQNRQHRRYKAQDAARLMSESRVSRSLVHGHPVATLRHPDETISITPCGYPVQFSLVKNHLLLLTRAVAVRTDDAACTDAVQQASDPKMGSIGARGGQRWMWMSKVRG